MGSSSTVSDQFDHDDHHHDDHQQETKRLATLRENKAVKTLKWVIFPVLVCAAVVMSVGTYVWIRNDEKDSFERAFEADAMKVIESFHSSVEQKLNAVNALAVALTSYANTNNLTFPNVTLPDFEVWGSSARVLADAMIIHWLPLVTDENRLGWEEYAYHNRFQADASFEKDAVLIREQDEMFGFTDDDEGTDKRRLQQQQQGNNEDPNVLDDGTGYRLRIWSNNGRGVDAEGSGPYLPIWQRSPVSGRKQAELNFNFATAKLFKGILPQLLKSQKTTLTITDVPIETAQARMNDNLFLSQFRHNVDAYQGDPLTFMVYPVFDSFQQQANRTIVGALATNLYWSLYFSDNLSTASRGIMCVLENSFNQSFTFRIDGSEATFVDRGDHHDPHYASLRVSSDINTFVREQGRPETRAYTTVPLNDDYGRYRLHVYPSHDTKEEFYTNKPATYTAVVAAIFSFTSFLFLMYDYCGERRQTIVRNRALENARRAAATEREINEYIAHQIRNPLSAAVSACHFVSSSIERTELGNSETRQLIVKDVEIIHSCLQFMDSVLRGLLDWHHARGKQLAVNFVPINILTDIFEPVSCMMYSRNENFRLILDAPESLEVATDALRLKQVILNLAKNAAKFVVRGFVRLRAYAKDERVFLCVEDSGPGISHSDKAALFSNFKGRLDLLDRSTGIGLCLCQELVSLLGGDIWLDESYDSGVEGCPGARFVVRLNHPPLVEKQELHPEKLGFDESIGSRPTSTTMESPNLDEKDVASSVTTSCLPETLSILFVDDDLMLRKLFTRAVRKLAPNWQIQEAASGEAALLRVDSGEQFDLIFMDQYMPGTERQLLGTETTRAMRSKGVESIICGLSANDVERLFIESGANDFVLKPLPCNKDDLSNLLLHIIDARRNNESLPRSNLTSTSI